MSPRTAQHIIGMGLIRPLVALMPFWSPLPTEKPKSPTIPHLHQVSHPRQPSRDVRRVHELNVNMREIHLVEVKYYGTTTVKIHSLRGL